MRWAADYLPVSKSNALGNPSRNEAGQVFNRSFGSRQQSHVAAVLSFQPLDDPPVPEHSEASEDSACPQE